MIIIKGNVGGRKGIMKMGLQLLYIDSIITGIIIAIAVVVNSSSKSDTIR